MPLSTVVVYPGPISEDEAEAAEIAVPPPPPVPETFVVSPESITAAPMAMPAPVAAWPSRPTKTEED